MLVWVCDCYIHLVNCFSIQLNATRTLDSSQYYLTSKTMRLYNGWNYSALILKLPKCLSDADIPFLLCLIHSLSRVCIYTLWYESLYLGLSLFSLVVSIVLEIDSRGSPFLNVSRTQYCIVQNHTAYYRASACHQDLFVSLGNSEIKLYPVSRFNRFFRDLGERLLRFMVGRHLNALMI